MCYTYKIPRLRAEWQVKDTFTTASFAGMTLIRMILKSLQDIKIKTLSMSMEKDYEKIKEHPDKYFDNIIESIEQILYP